MHRSTIRRATSVVALGAALALTAGACGDDEASAADASPAACAAAIDFNTAFVQAPREPGELQGYVQEAVAPVVTRLRGELPADLAPSASALERAVTTIARTGDPEAVADPEFEAAQRSIGQMLHERCGAESVRVDGVDYRFENAPDALDSGLVSFRFHNKGSEEHELVLMRRADGATEDLHDILHLPEEQMMEKASFVGVAYGGPGSTNYLAADLDPGTYFLLCFLPVGGTESGDPHFVHGMEHTFTVS